MITLKYNPVCGAVKLDVTADAAGVAEGPLILLDMAGVVVVGTNEKVLVVGEQNVNWGGLPKTNDRYQVTVKHTPPEENRTLGVVQTVDAFSEISTVLMWLSNNPVALAGILTTLTINANNRRNEWHDIYKLAKDMRKAALQSEITNLDASA